MKNILITGGAGFLGSNSAKLLLSQGAQVFVFDNLSRLGSDRNLDWLLAMGARFIHGDARNFEDARRAVFQSQADGILHFAGQVAMAESLARPLHDFQVNALGSMHFLEAAREFSNQRSLPISFFYSSTNKVYGDLENLELVETPTRYSPIGAQELDESLALDFRTPYGCSKGAADQAILDYSRRNPLIRSAVFRHSSMYGDRQFATETQGWIGWFCQKALEQKAGSQEPFTINGSGKQARDLLRGEDMARLYSMALSNPEALNGQAFNIGGGLRNSFSIIELLGWLSAELGVSLKFRPIEARASDQKYFVADCSKIRKALGWEPQISKEEGLRLHLNWMGKILAGDF